MPPVGKSGAGVLPTGKQMFNNQHPYLAVSQSKCNALPQYFGIKHVFRGLESQAFAGTGVEAFGDFVEVFLGVDGPD